MSLSRASVEQVIAVWRARAEEQRAKRADWRSRGSLPVAATHHARAEVYKFCADDLQAVLSAHVRELEQARRSEASQGDPATGVSG